MGRRLLLTIAAALIVTGVAIAALPRDGIFKGMTSQKQKIAIQVSDGAISALEISVKCGTRTIHTGSFPATAVKASGAFSFTDAQVPEGKLVMSGTFPTPTTLKGKFALSARGCKPVTFTARR